MAKPAGKPPAAKAAESAPKVVAENRKARFHYDILDTFEAGLVLRGTEVKVLRQGKCSLDEAYAKIEGDELWLVGCNIPEYSHGNLMNHEPKRRRKCLLHRRELSKLRAKAEIKGLTLVPLRLYFGGRGFAKVTIAVGKGRKLHDKREHEKQKEAQREMRER
ncbi:MAG: SsrA-binding protein SmpB [Planctomycetes bacterium]|nr:SsrA-binding protein SmpB [Planctomycetota bacterium]